MKRLYVLLAALVLATGCSRSNTAPAANDNRPEFVVNLLPSSEVPPVTNAENTASGTATIDFNLTKDPAGTITAATVDYRVELSGFPPTTTGLISAHIHPGAAGVANSPLQPSIISSGEVVLTNGVGTFSKLTITTVSVANAQAIINNPSGFYFNVHTTLNGGGALRGQLIRQ